MSDSSKNSSFAIYCMVKAPLHELKWFSNYHLSIGAERVFLYFDDPEDPAFNAFHDSRIICTKCDDVETRQEDRRDTTYWSKRIYANIRHAMTSCTVLGIRWLAIIDQDELIYSPAGLAKRIAQSGSDADLLHLEVWEALSPEEKYDNFFHQISFFKWQPLPPSYATHPSLEIPVQWTHFFLALLAARLAGLKNATVNKFLNAHKYGKVIIRTDLRFERATAHGPVHPAKYGYRTRRLKDSALLHFEACDFERWKTKFNAMETALSSLPRLWGHRRRYVRDYIKARGQGEEALRKFYKDTKSIAPARMRLMRCLGLVRKTNLEKHLFQDSSDLPLP